MRLNFIDEVLDFMEQAIRAAQRLRVVDLYLLQKFVGLQDKRARRRNVDCTPRVALVRNLASFGALLHLEQLFGRPSNILCKGLLNWRLTSA